MRLSLKSIVGAALLGLAVTSATQAAENVVLTMTTTVNPGGLSGGWSVFEQNSDPTLTSGLAGIQFNVNATGGVTLKTTLLRLPIGSDASLGGTGFSANRTAGTITPVLVPGNAVIGIRGNQAVQNTENGAGTVQSIFPFFGNQAVTVAGQQVPSGDQGFNNGGSGPDNNDISYASFSLPGLIASGTWTQTGTGGALTASGTTVLTTLLPASLPAATAGGANVQTFSPDAVVPGSVTIAAVPEPVAGGILLIGSLLGLSRRRRSTTKSA